MKKQILFVDDEQNVLKAFQRMLHQHSGEWDMTFVSCPQEASQVLRLKSFDAAVLDVKMAGKNGFVLLTELKNNAMNRDVEVILITGLEDESLKRQALNFGAADLLNKPVQKEDLIARLRNVLKVKDEKDTLRRMNLMLQQRLMDSQNQSNNGED